MKVEIKIETMKEIKIIFLRFKFISWSLVLLVDFHLTIQFSSVDKICFFQKKKKKKKKKKRLKSRD